MSRFLFSGTRNITFGTLKPGKNDPEIANLEFESHGFLENHKIMFSFQPKLGKIYVKWHIKAQILRYILACSVER